MFRIRLLALLLLPITLNCCRPSKSDYPPLGNAQEFSEYWDTGLAEISTFDLVQARYGNLNHGIATMIYVHEGFSASKQVKLDFPENSPDDVVPILKLNLTKDFLTGMYPYKLMLSVFTPRTESPRSLKEVVSVQEWCGTTYLQLNLDDKDYNLISFSYFEAEGDRKRKIEESILEDEIWNRIRLAPDKLPVGKIRILPGLFYIRFTHGDPVPAFASAQIQKISEKVSRYELLYPELKRTLKIDFESAFPYKIVGWEETYPDGDFRSEPRLLTTTAKFRRLSRIAYWEKHFPADRILRNDLGLPVN
ncbi:hypothetical protein LEP1GSC047_1300 [Leptospira inadai serovar Lyme str. 10]|uniref:Uncharacterized protein n=2 Tax=Leptospira inadai serovar Lyme TaxID=293084 RepID=V6HA98_9LEPT|nr:hypothetical protein [Leptospira inadai]EQA35263.1 hypothetical protein LEP1GSC047_1300 [Leptospira inadai serovar Lyme str. 10]PNV76029.1 septum formation inhibitor Maf [Leptospira inadai serovar Lyme]